MRKQHELFDQSFVISPAEGLDEPRLWVRRMVIWEHADNAPIRNIDLRPGMNIIWTPDDIGIGHGGGKTLFCRLLRYCLGEDNYGPSDHRERIAEAFPDGWVGAEIMLDKKRWGVVRPIGMRRKHYAVPGATPEEIVAGEHEPTGIQPLVQAIEESLLPSSTRALIPTHRQDHQAWLISLAWLSRDQECRFDNVLDWRSSVSESNSPASALNKAEKLQTLRVLLQAYTPQEHMYRQELSALAEQVVSATTEMTHLKWEIDRLKCKLSKELNIEEPDSLAPPVGVQQYATALRRRSSSDDIEIPQDLDKETQSAKEEYEKCREVVVEINSRVATLEGTVPLHEQLVSALEDEYPGLYASAKEAENYPCPICSVPISRVLAEGCSLSKEIPDLAECERQLNNNQKNLQIQQRKLAEAKKELTDLKRDRESALRSERQEKQKYDDLLNRYRQAQQLKFRHKATEIEVERLKTLQEEHSRLESEHQSIKADEGIKRKSIDACVKDQSKALLRLNEKFGPIIHYLIGEDAVGEARLSSNDLDLKVRLGGDRSTSAIESLKVVAFDIASLCLSIEGFTNAPAFCVHDSPREADLGLPLYQRLFYLMEMIESTGTQPLFQYIVTTTTHPPDAFQHEPWLKLELSGVSAYERLLRRNL